MADRNGDEAIAFPLQSAHLVFFFDFLALRILCSPSFFFSHTGQTQKESKKVRSKKTEMKMGGQPSTFYFVWDSCSIGIEHKSYVRDVGISN